MRPVDKAQDRLGRRHAPVIRKAIADSWSIQQVIQAWRELSPQTLLSRKQIIQWLRVHMVFDSKPINKALANLYADATVFGKQAADYELRKAGVKKRLKSLDVADVVKAGNDTITANFDWNNWTPGNLPAALLVNPPAGLAKRLAERGKLIKGIDDTTTDRIGTVLADGLAAGLSPSVVASDVAGVLIDSRTNWADELEGRLLQVADDVKRAEVIARTEMSRAVYDEKQERYDDMGVEQIQWITVSPCDACSEIDQEIISIGDTFSNGWSGIDDSHPNCNCTIAPVIDGFDVNIPTYANLDDIELSLKPDTLRPEPVVGIPSSLDVERALSRLAILPSPADPTMRKPEKFVESPWTVVPVPAIDPNIWDTATLQLINMEDLFSTDPFLKRKNVAKHISIMGQAQSPFRSYAMVYEHDNKAVVIDGHHRLMSLWLLGLNKAPVWLVKENN